jgi:hypothetical protein
MRLLLVMALLASPASVSANVSANAPASVVTAHPEAMPYDPARNAPADVDAALARARTSGKRVILAMGANWCHDSKGLAGWFETPRFKTMLATKYEVVFIDVGTPQTGNGRNIDIVRRFGIRKIKGTPMVLVLSSEGQILNKKDAPSWRNAAGRSEDDIFGYFDAFGAGASSRR